MDHHRSSLILRTVVVVWAIALPSIVVSAVDPADITPVANLVGGLLAIPGARLLAALCVILAVLALTHGHGGVCLFLVIVAGVVLVAPVVIKAVVLHVAGTVRS